MLKVNLGAGENTLPGWVNVDIKKFSGIDIVSDVASLPFEDNTVDIIYACHILEHFGRHECISVLKEWHRVLRKGGIIRISVPNFISCLSWYLDPDANGTLKDILGLLKGGQKDQYDFHKMIFDKNLLREYLEIVGFENVERYDWTQTDHADHDDYSKAYLPHMDKEYGRLMSLNMEGTKC